MALAEGAIAEVPETFTLEYISATSGTHTVPTATVRLRRAGQAGRVAPRAPFEADKNAKVLQDAGTGDGPVDAALKAIDRLTQTRGRLMDYSLRAVSQGKDALGKVTVKVDFGN